jgi:cell division protein FtsL
MFLREVAMTEKVAERQIKISTLVILVVVIMTELFFFSWFHVQSIHMGYKINSQLKQEKELQYFQKKLRVELAQLTTPERIMEIASEQLGLVLPESGQVIVVK